MSETNTPQARYGHERRCPHCGNRVAQRAHTCFFCGASLEDAPHRRLTIPWADVILFLVIGGVVAFWWLRSPDTPAGRQISLFGQHTSDIDQARIATAASEPAPTSLPPTATPAPTATLEPTATPLPTPLRHKVHQGDTLAVIAGFYGSTVQDIIDANGLDPSGLIRVGQELIIPVAGPSGGPGPTETPNGGTLVYTVQSGDTVESIAMRFNSQIDWILQANNLKPTTLLQINQSLLVPLSKNTPTPTATVLVSPTPIPTPGAHFSAPALLTPPDGSTVTGNDELLLSWASVGVLAEDQWYVVTLEIACLRACTLFRTHRQVGGEEPIAPYWTKSTAWRLSPEYRIAGQAETEFTWRVQVFAGPPDHPGDSVSPSSALRHFTWK